MKRTRRAESLGCSVRDAHELRARVEKGGGCPSVWLTDDLMIFKTICQPYQGGNGTLRGSCEVSSEALVTEIKLCIIRGAHHSAVSWCAMFSRSIRRLPFAVACRGLCRGCAVRKPSIKLAAEGRVSAVLV